MNPAIELIATTFLISCVVSYAFWTRTRVWILRQDLFDVRDRLWIAMARADQLEDPEHRKLRDLLNASIRLAPTFSFFSIARVLNAEPKAFVVTNAETPEPVREAYQAMGVVYAEYLLNYTLLGWTLVILACVLTIGLFPVRALRSRIARLAVNAMNTAEFLKESTGVRGRYVPGGI